MDGCIYTQKMSQQIVPCTWQHASEFVRTLNESFFQVKNCSFWGSYIIQMQTPDVHEIFEDKLATLKIDGVRHVVILFVEKNLKIRGIVMTRSGRLYDIIDPTFCQLSTTTQLKPGLFHVLDCEYINESHWIAFDILVFRSISGKRACFRLDFTERYELLKKVFDTDIQTDKILLKPYFEIQKGSNNFCDNIIENTCSTIGLNNIKHDGIVFQPKKGYYPVGTNMNLLSGRGLKWKHINTLDLAVERVKLHEIKEIHKKVYNTTSFGVNQNLSWNYLHRPLCYYGVSSRFRSNLSSSYKVPETLCKLKCISDFHANLQTIMINDIPLCIDLPLQQQEGVKEFTFSSDLVPEFVGNREDKGVTQLNKARTVAGVLWQSKQADDLDDFVSNPDKLPPKIEIPLPTMLKNGVKLQDYLRGLMFNTSEEHEFKIIQTKAPRPGIIFPSYLEPDYTNSSSIDSLHFERVIQGIIRKYGKADPPVVNSIDFFIDGIRMTAYEKKIETKNGVPLIIYETNSFEGIHKTAEGTSHIVEMDSVEESSGYVYRLDSRSENIESVFYKPNLLPDNPVYDEFLQKLIASKTSRKRKTEIPLIYKRYRLIDRQELRCETERNVNISRIRRISLEPPTIGENVQVSFKGNWIDATIQKINGNMYDIKYTTPIHSFSSITSSDTIPLIVDSGVVRMKCRKTFEFPGFVVDLTRTKTIKNYTSTPTRRLHHLRDRCDRYEIEIELKNINRNASFFGTLQEVMRDIFEFMHLDENSFLFKNNLTIQPSPSLQKSLDEYSESIGFNKNDTTHVVYQRVLNMFGSRYVRESDFHSMYTYELQKIPYEPYDSYDINLNGHIQYNNPWIDVNSEDTEHNIKRRIFEGVKLGSNAEYLTKTLGLELFGTNTFWKLPTTFEWICKRLNAQVILEISEDFVDEIKQVLSGKTDSTNPFFKTAFVLSDHIVQMLFIQNQHAWWDENEITVVLNDLFDIAQNYANSLYRSTNSYDIWKNSDYDLLYYQTHYSMAKVCLFCGFIRACRNILNTKMVDDHVHDHDHDEHNKDHDKPFYLDVLTQKNDICIYTPRGKENKTICMIQHQPTFFLY